MHSFYECSPSPKTCPRCGQVVDEAWNFCPACEEPLNVASSPHPKAEQATEVKEKTCPRCGQVVDEAWNFCPTCETALNEAPPPPPPDPETTASHPQEDAHNTESCTHQQCPFCGHITSKNARNCPACEAALRSGGFPFLPNAAAFGFLIAILFFLGWLFNTAEDKRDKKRSRRDTHPSYVYEAEAEEEETTTDTAYSTEYEEESLREGESNVENVYVDIEQPSTSELEPQETWKTIDGMPFELRGGTALSGDYILTSETHILSGTLRVPSGVKMRLDLRGGTLEGSDIVIAEGGELELRNGTVRQPLRNRGTLTLHALHVLSNIKNGEGAHLLLTAGSSIGSDGTLQSRENLLAGRYYNCPYCNSEGALHNKGTVQGSQVVTICCITNEGNLHLDGGVYRTIENYSTSFSLRNVALHSFKNAGTAVAEIKGGCYFLTNEGTLTLDGACEELANAGKFVHYGELKYLTNTRNGICYLFKTAFRGGKLYSNLENAATPQLDFIVGEEGTSRVYNDGTLFVGQVDFTLVNLSIDKNTYYKENGIGKSNYGTLVGCVPTKNGIIPYNGEPIAFSSSCTTIETKLVAYAKPGMFVGNLPDGYFAEERPSDKPGLVDLVVVKE